MSTLTHADGAANPGSSYYWDATSAAKRGEYEAAKQLCLSAAAIFERDGEDRELSKAYHKLGEVSYLQEHYDEAESWYRKALDIDNHIGDERGAATTLNNFSAVENSRGNYDAAVELLQRAIEIKQRLEDEVGLAYSYRQMSITEQSRSDFDAASTWALKAVELDEKHGEHGGLAFTYLNLYTIATAQGDTTSAEAWWRKSFDAVAQSNSGTTAIDIGRHFEDAGYMQEAQSFYEKAMDIAIGKNNEEYQSISLLYLAHLSCQMGEYETSKQLYVQAIEIDERLQATDRVSRSYFSLGNICLAAINGQRPDFRTAWKWLRKSVEVRPDASWRDFVRAYWHYLYYRVRYAFSRSQRQQSSSG